MQRLRIIAPLVVSTLYNGLWSDSRSEHFTLLCTHVGHEQQFLAPLLITESSSAFVFIVINFEIHVTVLQRNSKVKPRSLCQALLL